MHAVRYSDSEGRYLDIFRWNFILLSGIDKMRQLANSVTKEGIQQFLSEMQWKRSAIPEFSTIIHLCQTCWKCLHPCKKKDSSRGKTCIPFFYRMLFDIRKRFWSVKTCSGPSSHISAYRNQQTSLYLHWHVWFFLLGYRTQIAWENASLPCEK